MKDSLLWGVLLTSVGLCGGVIMLAVEHWIK